MESHNRYSVPSGPGMPDWLRVLLIFLVIAGVATGGVLLYLRNYRKAEEAAQAAGATPKGVRHPLGLGEIDTTGGAGGEFRPPPNASGSEAGAEKVVRALTSTMFEVQAASKMYEALQERMSLDGDLDLAAIRSREDLGRQREAAREFLEANAALHESLENLQARFREKLAQEGIPPGQLTAVTEAAARGFEQTLPTQRRMRVAQTALGKTWLELCDLLEAEWGKWSVQDGKPVFESAEATAKYGILQQRFDRAMQVQTKVRGELPVLPR